jgi:hypothetical protein
MLDKLLLEAGISIAVLLGVAGVTWFAADAHYSQALASLEGQLKGAATAQAEAVAKQKQQDAEAAKEIDNEAQNQIGTMAGTIGDLSQRLWLQEHSPRRTITLCPSTPSAARSSPEPERPATPASPGPAPGPQNTVTVLDPAIVSDAIDLGIDAIKAELFWRSYARKTGQAPPGD